VVPYAPLAGKALVLAGLLVILGVWAGASVAVCTVPAILAGLIPAAYSYVVYRRLQDRPP
jgi:hypothetical protein